MSNPLHRERVKVFVAIVAAITGASLVVFTGMAAHYKSQIKETELRYEALQARLADEKYITRADVNSILARMEAVEETVKELKATAEEKGSVKSHSLTTE